VRTATHSSSFSSSTGHAWCVWADGLLIRLAVFPSVARLLLQTECGAWLRLCVAHIATYSVLRGLLQVACCELRGLSHRRAPVTAVPPRAVARVTQKILALAEHMRSNRKDFSARRRAPGPRCWLAPPRLGFALCLRVTVLVPTPGRVL
jgi:hypothetical protein